MSPCRTDHLPGDRSCTWLPSRETRSRSMIFVHQGPLALSRTQRPCNCNHGFSRSRCPRRLRSRGPGTNSRPPQDPNDRLRRGQADTPRWHLSVRFGGASRHGSSARRCRLLTKADIVMCYIGSHGGRSLETTGFSCCSWCGDGHVANCVASPTHCCPRHSVSGQLRGEALV